MFYPELNYTAIITATIIFFTIGGIWYSPFFLGKAWQKLKNFDNQELTNNSLAMIFSFLICLISSWLMYLLIGLSNTTKFEGGVLVGLMAGLLVVILNANQLIFTNKKSQLNCTKLFFIDQGYNLVGLATIGGILAIWR